MTRPRNSVDRVLRAPSGPHPCHFSCSIRKLPASSPLFRWAKAQTQALQRPEISQISREHELEERLETTEAGLSCVNEKMEGQRGVTIARSAWPLPYLDSLVVSQPSCHHLRTLPCPLRPPL